MNEEKLDQDRRYALGLVEALWSSLDWEKIPQRLLPRIYSIFQDWIQESAYTGSLHTFVSNFQDTAICISVSGDRASHVAAVIASGRDRHLLQILREETSALIIFMRARKDERKEIKRKEFLEKLSPEEQKHLAKYEKMKETEAKKKRR